MSKPTFTNAADFFNWLLYVNMNGTAQPKQPVPKPAPKQQPPKKKEEDFGFDGLQVVADAFDNMSNEVVRQVARAMALFCRCELYLALIHDHCCEPDFCGETDFWDETCRLSDLIAAAEQDAFLSELDQVNIRMNASKHLRNVALDLPEDKE